MSFSKQSFDKAKQNVLDRLTGWATDTKQENDGGIPRLHDEFKHAFKKIEWNNKGKRGNFLFLKDEHAKKGQKSKIKQSENGKKSQKPKQVEAVSATEERKVFDSNSSNVSSRLDTRSELRSRKSTPIKSRHGTPAEFLNKTLKDGLDIDLGNGVEDTEAWAESQQVETLPIEEKFLPQLHRRKKKRKSKKRTTELSANTPAAPPGFSIQVDAANDINVDNQPLLPEKNTLLSSVNDQAKLGGAPSSAAIIKVKSKTGMMIDLVLKRPQKLIRPGTAMDNTALRTEEKKPAGSDERRKHIIANFRRIVKLLIHVRVLLNVSRLRIEEEEKEKTKGFKGDDGSVLTFDAGVFKTAMTSYGGLTNRARKALKKIPAERNEEDANILMEVLLRLPFFIKYPKKMKQDLARMLWYDKFEEGRVIVRQGDPGSRMYFVVSGPGVSLRRTDKFDEDGEPIVNHYHSIGAGSTFGELALIRDMMRDYTAVCTGPSEFLSLSKCEFNTVLRNHWEKECNIRYSFLRSCEHFQTWTDQQLQACADSSELKEYKDNTVIIGDLMKFPDSVFFLLRGRCEIVKHITMVKHQSPYLRSTILLPNMARQRPDFLNKPYGRKLRSMREEYVYLTVTTLDTGCYFGAGEDLTDIYVLSKGKVECVVVHSAQFSIQGKSELLRNLKSDREAILPSSSELYRKFQINRKWSDYRQKLLNEIITRKKSRFSTSYVPYCSAYQAIVKNSHW